jgi:hypothetical protein
MSYQYSSLIASLPMNFRTDVGAGCGASVNSYACEGKTIDMRKLLSSTQGQGV